MTHEERWLRAILLCDAICLDMLNLRQLDFRSCDTSTKMRYRNNEPLNLKISRDKQTHIT